ncbi:conjugal transfer protein [Oceanobacillus kimchii]|uniref:conjugal transfer protein n=1 Tax=Oceanobacillus kimchii TaxID=746691 RepID=UPI0021A30241|nr:conjugal transfer protein [Oceanobacillus kimchii]MCT1577306.1 conjugal transfer protein [Oceanobacillus kimchii]MCT2136912.1 conjugal transfer protein [Oceanobacillus kimchii]
MDKEKTSNRFKERLKRVKKQPKEKTVVRKDRSRLIATCLWLLLITILFVSVLGTWLSLNTRSSLNETNQVVEAKQAEDEETFNVISADEYISNFVRAFVNVQDDDAALEERAETLRNYFVYTQEFQDESNVMYTMPDFEGDRTLNRVNLFNVVEEDDHYLMQYKVNLTNRFKKEEIDQELLLNVPVLMENEKYSVKSAPYFTEVYSLNGNIEVEEGHQTIEEYNGAEKENILAFVANFFEKYTTEDMEEMGYIMNDPSSLNGAFVFDELQETKVIAEQETFIVVTKVMFRDALTNIPHVNEVELVIRKNNNNYFVEELTYH